MNLTSRTLNSLRQRSARFIQAKDSALVYTVDFGAEIQADTIATAKWSSTPSLTINGQADTNTTTAANLSGSEGDYLVSVVITTTTSGETIERTINLNIYDPAELEGDYCG